MQQEPKTIRRLLEECINANKTGSEKPIVTTLHLNSGRDKTGQAMALEMDRSENKSMILFQLYTDDRREPTKNLLYVDIAHIEAVTVWDAVKPPPTPPTRWELKQKAHADSELLTKGFQSAIKYDIDFAAFEESDANFSMLKQLLTQLTTFLEAYVSANDSLAMDAVKSKISAIKIGASDASTVDLKDKILFIFLETKNNVIQSLHFDKLINAIEKAL
jgi:hypothetical protein